MYVGDKESSFRTAYSKGKLTGTSLAVPWLGLCASTAGGVVQSLVGKLGSCMHMVQPKKKENLLYLQIYLDDVANTTKY